MVCNGGPEYGQVPCGKVRDSSESGKVRLDPVLCGLVGKDWHWRGKVRASNGRSGKLGCGSVPYAVAGSGWVR